MLSYFVVVANGVLDWDWCNLCTYVRPGGVVLPGDWFILRGGDVTISVVYDCGSRWLVREPEKVLSLDERFGKASVARSYSFDLNDHDSVVRAFRGALSYYVSSLS